MYFFLTSRCRMSAPRRKPSQSTQQSQPQSPSSIQPLALSFSAREHDARTYTMIGSFSLSSATKAGTDCSRPPNGLKRASHPSWGAHRLCETRAACPPLSHSILKSSYHSSITSHSRSSSSSSSSSSPISRPSYHFSICPITAARKGDKGIYQSMPSSHPDKRQGIPGSTPLSSKSLFPALGGRSQSIFPSSYPSCPPASLLSMLYYRLSPLSDRRPPHPHTGTLFFWFVVNPCFLPTHTPPCAFLVRHKYFIEAPRRPAILRIPPSSQGPDPDPVPFPRTSTHKPSPLAATPCHSQPIPFPDPDPYPRRPPQLPPRPREGARWGERLRDGGGEGPPCHWPGGYA